MARPCLLLPCLLSATTHFIVRTTIKNSIFCCGFYAVIYDQFKNIIIDQLNYLFCSITLMWSIQASDERGGCGEPEVASDIQVRFWLPFSFLVIMINSCLFFSSIFSSLITLIFLYIIYYNWAASMISIARARSQLMLKRLSHTIFPSSTRCMRFVLQFLNQ